jgi:hypothetical protein
MYGTEPKRLRFREERIRTANGWSSTNAGPIFEPKVPEMNNTEVRARTARRTQAN